MSARVLLNLLNELRKRVKMRGLPSILSLFLNEFNNFNNILNELRKKVKMRGLLSILSIFLIEFNKFNNNRARMLDSIYHMTLRLL